MIVSFGEKQERKQRESWSDVMWFGANRWRVFAHFYSRQLDMVAFATTHMLKEGTYLRLQATKVFLRVFFNSHSSTTG
jgi:hypothetical protein